MLDPEKDNNYWDYLNNMLDPEKDNNSKKSRKYIKIPVVLVFFRV
jgi:hypothetical protein